MNKAVAILFSLVLVLAQGAGVSCVMAQPASAGKRPCACDTHRCCVNKAAPDADSLPLAPLPSTNPGTSLFLHIWAVVSFTLPPAASSESSSTVAVLPSSDRVPLYQQNCAYLI